MINLNQLCRQLASGSTTRVISRLLANGRCHDPIVRERLASAPTGDVIAAGLLLQRVCELTYGRSQHGSDLARRLCNAQHADGMFSDTRGCRVLTTAIALRALIDWNEQYCDVDEQVTRCITRGVAALSACQGANGLLDNDAVASAITLWQLGDRAAFRDLFEAVHCDALSDAVRQAGAAVHDSFARFAVAMAA